MSRLAVVVLVIVASSACFPAPETLRVERVLGDSAVGQFESFDRAVVDAAAVAELDAMLRSLPAAPDIPGSEPFCPIAWGLRYRLTFAHLATTTLVATIEADGCRYAYLGPADRRATTESFWARLSGVLGFYTRRNDLFPLPRDIRP